MGPKNKFKAIFLIVLAFAVSLMLVFGTIDYIANHRTFESGVIAAASIWKFPTPVAAKRLS